MKKHVVFSRLIAFVAAVLLVAPVASFADGMPEQAPKRKPKPAYVPPAPAPVVAPPPPPAPVEIAKTETILDDCEWRFRLSPGVTTWFFEDEDTLPGAAGFADIWRTDIPLNLRVGVEGRHMYLGQDNAEFAKEWDDKTTKITFIRIPFAVEYMFPVAEDTTMYLGGGPDIIHTANDISETSVGGHLAGRVHYALDDNWGVAVEAGYLWAEIDGEPGDINLGGAYVTPQAAYTF